MLQQTLTYLTQSVLLTLEQLLIVLGPVLLLAVVLDTLSRFIRRRAAGFVGLNAYVWLTAPGVMVHELGHAFFCVIFGHRIVRMRLFSPQADGSLGSVEHAFNPRSAYQRIGNFFIGTGPIWFGTAIVCLLTWGLLGSPAVDASSQFTTPRDGAAIATVFPQIAASVWQLFRSLLRPSVVSTWQFWVFAYLVFCIGSHITLSRPDIRGAAQGFVSLLAFLLLFNLLTGWIAPDFMTHAGQWLLRSSAIFYAAGLFVIGLNIILAVLVYALSSTAERS